MTTAATTTLQLTNPDKAFSLLGDNAGYYGDNGGDPDGYLWLPSEPLDKNDTGVEKVIAAGYGTLVKAFYFDKSEISEFVKMYKGATPEAIAEGNGNNPESPDWNDYCEALTFCDGVYGFAGYSSSEKFVVVRK